MGKIATVFDPSEYLDSEEKIAEYLSAIMEDYDWSLLIQAIGHVAKARGISRVALESGLGRESLYKSFHAGSKPRFDTVMKVLGAMNIKMQFVPSTIGKSRQTRRRITKSA